MKILISNFLGSLISEKGFFGVFKIDIFIFRVLSFNALWKFLWQGNSGWNFLGAKFGSKDLFGFLFEDFFGF